MALDTDVRRFASPRTGHDGFHVFVVEGDVAVLQPVCECGWRGRESTSLTALLTELSFHRRAPGPPPAPVRIDCTAPPDPVAVDGPVQPRLL